MGQTDGRIAVSLNAPYRRAWSIRTLTQTLTQTVTLTLSPGSDPNPNNPISNHHREGVHAIATPNPRLLALTPNRSYPVPNLDRGDVHAGTQKLKNLDPTHGSTQPMDNSETAKGASHLHASKTYNTRYTVQYE